MGPIWAETSGGASGFNDIDRLRDQAMQAAGSNSAGRDTAARGYINAVAGRQTARDGISGVRDSTGNPVTNFDDANRIKNDALMKQLKSESEPNQTNLTGSTSTAPPGGQGTIPATRALTPASAPAPTVDPKPE